MHSPGVKGPSMTMRRPDYYNGYSDVRSPPREPSSKILQSLLYNIAHSGYLNSPPSEGNNGAIRNSYNRSESENTKDATENASEYSRSRVSHGEVSPTQRHHPYRIQHPHQAAPGHDPSHPRCYQTPSSTVTSQTRGSRDGTAYPDNYLSPRHRSSSIGSAGSSFRDSRSPSHDSTVSHDSLSRCSPLSIASSPSPSPPTLERNTNSKLLGILKGASYSYPYGITSNKTQDDSTTTNNHLDNTRRRSSSASDHSVTLSHNSKKNATYSKDRTPKQYETHTQMYKKKHNLSDYGRHKRGYNTNCQEEPMDLSCKPKQTLLDNTPSPRSPRPMSRQLSWTSDYYVSSNVDENDTDTLPKKSILESILCANKDKTDISNDVNSTPLSHDTASLVRSASIEGSPLPSSVSLSHLKVPNSPVYSPDSPMSNAPSPTPPSPVPSACSVVSQFGVSSPQPRCPWRQQVTLAKKTLYPVRARVSDWFLKIIKFAKSNKEFSSLSDSDKTILLQHSWTRLLLLYMAENNFHFAVTPVHEDIDDGRPPAISGIDPSEPTMDSVEMVQTFIRKCQTLGLESEEYGYLRVVTLFHAGCPGLENADFIENICSSARLSLQNHVRSSHPDEKLRYSSLLLCVHTLFGVNCGMVQTLFCQHVAKDGSLDDEVKSLLLKQDDSVKEGSDKEVEA